MATGEELPPFSANYASLCTFCRIFPSGGITNITLEFVDEDKDVCLELRRLAELHTAACANDAAWQEFGDSDEIDQSINQPQTDTLSFVLNEFSQSINQPQPDNVSFVLEESSQSINQARPVVLISEPSPFGQSFNLPALDAIWAVPEVTSDSKVAEEPEYDQSINQMHPHTLNLFDLFINQSESETDISLDEPESDQSTNQAESETDISLDEPESDQSTNQETLTEVISNDELSNDPGSCELFDLVEVEISASFGGVGIPVGQPPSMVEISEEVDIHQSSNRSTTSIADSEKLAISPEAGPPVDATTVTIAPEHSIWPSYFLAWTELNDQLDTGKIDRPRADSPEIPLPQSPEIFARTLDVPPPPSLNVQSKKAKMEVATPKTYPTIKLEPIGAQDVEDFLTRKVDLTSSHSVLGHPELFLTRATKGTAKKKAELQKFKLNFRERFDRMPEAIQYELMSKMPKNWVSITPEGLMVLKPGKLGMNDKLFMSKLSEFQRRLRSGNYDTEVRRIYIAMACDTIDPWKVENFEPVYGDLMRQAAEANLAKPPVINPYPASIPLSSAPSTPGCSEKENARSRISEEMDKRSDSGSSTVARSDGIS
ncbi:hypothetical protein BV898_11798 [Hypsibius exemplaris]|uniref:ASX DEUBAD domain-containing protein n=1 Tax=Hypsibius exemplaris TaxID=2072580 RepID=A0A1W0WFS2_HYPEX|nr:hypothetical protein BV898_11798 [Hypsibius exemplaris]